MKALAPKDVHSISQQCLLRTDGCDTELYWIMIQPLINGGQEIILCKQANGEKATESIRIPRKDFLRLVAWYLKPQKLRKVRQ